MHLALVVHVRVRFVALRSLHHPPPPPPPLENPPPPPNERPLLREEPLRLLLLFRAISAACARALESACVSDGSWLVYDPRVGRIPKVDER
mmetsp:Transcript_24939/g.46612  ORF Transcript_24939/g.46612 Transcript_24939/m.46612 type:complete len:91 (+) Transcript_24939:183-455(+)